jgi:hypothetical protein
MRICVLVLGIVLCLCSPAFGQDTPSVEIFGGYSYLNVDTNNLNLIFGTNNLSHRQSANGWETSVSSNINRLIAVEGDFAGYYKTYGLGIVNINVHDYSYAAGPRINFRPVFFHVLFGGDKLTGSASVFSASQTKFASAFGGGAQWKVAPHIAVRGSADYVLTHHNIFGGPDFTQNNIRASVGIVYTIGGTGQGSSRLRNQTSTVQRTSSAPVQQASSTPVQTRSTSEAALLGVSGYESESGFKITTIRTGSPAVQLSLNPGDVILRIDGREVRSSREIEAAIAASTGGTIRVSWLFQTSAVGMMAAEREVRVR